MFAVYTGPILACFYECRWLDWSDPEHRIRVDASGVDVELVWALVQCHGHDPQLLELEQILHPRIVRRTGQQTGEPYDGFVDWAWKHQVAYGFAELVALPHDVWLRWRDDLSDEEDWIQHGAVKVGGSCPLPPRRWRARIRLVVPTVGSCAVRSAPRLALLPSPGRWRTAHRRDPSFLGRGRQPAGGPRPGAGPGRSDPRRAGGTAPRMTAV
jgi:hypothetical protein